jgi:hypothetical protein
MLYKFGILEKPANQYCINILYGFTLPINDGEVISQDARSPHRKVKGQ